MWESKRGEKGGKKERREGRKNTREETGGKRGGKEKTENQERRAWRDMTSKNKTQQTRAKEVRRKTKGEDISRRVR